MGKSTISMAIFNSYVSHYQRVHPCTPLFLNPTYRECRALKIRCDLWTYDTSPKKIDLETTTEGKGWECGIPGLDFSSQLDESFSGEILELLVKSCGLPCFCHGFAMFLLCFCYVFAMFCCFLIHPWHP